MSVHTASGHGIGCQAVLIPYIYIYIVTNIQAHARRYKFHHLSYLREARYVRQFTSLQDCYGKVYIITNSKLMSPICFMIYDDQQNNKFNLKSPESMWYISKHFDFLFVCLFVCLFVWRLIAVNVKFSTASAVDGDAPPPLDLQLTCPPSICI